MREILITVQEEEKRVAFVADSVLEEFYIERESGEQLVGNIYKGRVVNVTSAIQASFVDIGLGKNGFLHISDIMPEVALFREMEEEEPVLTPPPSESLPRPQSIQDAVKEGQEVLVQVMKAPIGSKGVRLTTNIGIPGRHIVLMPSARLRGISRKIADRNERVRLKKMLDQSRLPKDVGIIVRTAAVGINIRELNRELKFLLATWKRVQRRIKITGTPGCVHSELDLVLRTVRDALTEHIHRVVVDSKREYKRLRKFISIFLPKFKPKLELYQESVLLFERYGIEKEINKLLNRKLWLKKGGYIVIDPTEALVTIDVNSGKYVKTKDIEETALKTNLAAAKEIGRQLRLRNIGGIVIIDFIDMESITHQKLVLKELKEATSGDKAKINIYPFSKLGLVEITRQRVKDSLAHEIFQSCPYCHGRGKVKALDTLGIEIKRKLQEEVKAKAVRLIAHPDVCNYLREEGLVDRWRRSLKRDIKLEEDKTFHIEEYELKGI